MRNEGCCPERWHEEEHQDTCGDLESLRNSPKSTGAASKPDGSGTAGFSALRGSLRLGHGIPAKQILKEPVQSVPVLVVFTQTLRPN